jgi:hypothetical protein
LTLVSFRRLGFLRLYLVFVRLPEVLTGSGDVSQLRLEKAVVRHHVNVLRRTSRRPELKDRTGYSLPEDRNRDKQLSSIDG